MVTKGRVFFEDTGDPAVSFKVELWDSDVGSDDFVASTTTDSNGNYSISHKKKQDPRWFGKKKKKGDFYIKVFNSQWKKVFQSKVYSNYSPSTLTINVALNSIVVEHGVNIVYGTILGEYPNGTTSSIPGIKVVVKDDDLIVDDFLGDYLVGTDGKFYVPFREKDYKPGWWPASALEGKPDIFVSVYKKESGGDERWKRIWKSNTFDEANLPLKVDIKVPIILLSGEIKSYKKCANQENQTLATQPVTDLIAKAWDRDILVHDFLGECEVYSKETTGHFNITVYGSRDEYPALKGSDIYVKLYDKHDGRPVWESREYANVTTPTHIKLNNNNPIEVVDQCSDVPSVPQVQAGTGKGTKIILLNKSGETRYIYKKTTYPIQLEEEYIGSVANNTKITVNVACGEAAYIRAKSTLSDTYNAVTWEIGIIGACVEALKTIPVIIWV